MVAFHSAGAAGCGGFIPGCLGGSLGLPRGEIGGLLGDPTDGLLGDPIGRLLAGSQEGECGGLLGGLTSLSKGNLGFG